MVDHANNTSNKKRSSSSSSSIIESQLQQQQTPHNESHHHQQQQQRGNRFISSSSSSMLWNNKYILLSVVIVIVIIQLIQFVIMTFKIDLFTTTTTTFQYYNNNNINDIVVAINNNNNKNPDQKQKQQQQLRKDHPILTTSPSTTKSSTNRTTTSRRRIYDNYCLWDAYNDKNHCYLKLLQHITVSLQTTRRNSIIIQQQQQQRSTTSTTTSNPNTKSKNSNNHNNNNYDIYKSIIHRRYLLLGDSTIFRLYIFSTLQQYLQYTSIQQYQQYRTTLYVQQQQLFLQRECTSTSTTTTTNNNNNNNETATAKTSTDTSSSSLQCSLISCGRCNTAEELQFQRIDDWRLPIFPLGEGPIKFGLDNPYCTDCDGCNTQLMTCTLIDSSDSNSDNSIIPSTTITTNTNTVDNNYYDDADETRIKQCVQDIETIVTKEQQQEQYIGASYGGYISIEFARDVEIQTEQYTTTQENVLLHYIATKWNTNDQMIYEFGYPICIVSTGHHDVAIENITKSVYLNNVQWYLDLLVQQCEYIIWISNNCPLTEDYLQTPEKTYEWNMDVYDIIQNMTQQVPTSYNNIFFLDIFNASMTYPHHDNIHMTDEWYQSLGSLLQRIMEQVTQ